MPRAKSDSGSPGRSASGVRDVARMAGVSTATVSRTFNQPERVSLEVRARVLAIAAQLNYVPDPAARALVSQKSHRIGVLLPTVQNSIFAQFVEALQKRLRAAGYAVLIGVYEFDEKLEFEEARGLIEAGIDALVLTGARRSAELRDMIAARRLPCVLTSIHIPGDDHAPCVGYDNRAGTKAAAGYLLDLGHRDIGMMEWPAARNDRAELRRQGVEDALAERGLTLPPERVVECSFTVTEGRAALRHLLRVAPEITAVVCGNDVLAIGALLEAQAMGIDVPGDLSITGYDGLEMASQMIPSLTTVHVPMDIIGARTAETLLAMLAGDVVPRNDTIATNLIVRDSTAPPRPLVKKSNKISIA